MPDAPDLPRLMRDYTYDQIIAGVCKKLSTPEGLDEGHLFAIAEATYYGRQMKEFTADDHAAFAKKASECRLGERLLPICVFSFALVHYYGAQHR